MRKILIALLAVASVTSLGACKKQADKAEVEAIVKAYIEEHPDEIIASLQKYQRTKGPGAAASTNIDMNKYGKQLLEDADSAVYGNPNGKKVVVEFFDYNCGYCKKMLPNIVQLVQEEKDVKVIFKELPVLGPTSETAALAAIAVNKLYPNKYFEFHSAMMQHQGQKDDAGLKEVAKKAGIDGDKIVAAIKEEKYKKILEENVKLARELGIGGTPTYVINGKLQRGAMDYAGFKAAANNTGAAAPAKK